MPGLLAIIDLETSGLDVQNDCILEIAMAIVDPAQMDFTGSPEARAKDAGVLDVEKFLVLPPDVDGPKSFAAWERRFEKENPYVYTMHSTEHDGRSLLGDLREAASDAGKGVAGYDVGFVETSLRNTLRTHDSVEAARTMDLDDQARGANSSYLFTGNSIANLDIPILRRQMPRLHAAMHYRILDVSVIKTWLVDIVKAPLPKEIELAISKGKCVEDAAAGGPTFVETHRAYDDVIACISQLRAVTSWMRGSP